MSEIQIFPGRISAEGAQRLFSALQEEIASGRDLGPRGSQIRALGHSLEQASHELRREMKWISIASSTEDHNLPAPFVDMLQWQDDIMRLADALARLGALARTHPT